MNNQKNIFNTQLTPGVPTRVLKWRKIVYVLGTIILTPIVLASIFGGSIMLLFYGVEMLAIPLFIVSLIWLVIIGVSDKLDNTENKSFLGKNWRKAVLIAFILILVVGVIMFLLLRKYYQ